MILDVPVLAFGNHKSMNKGIAHTTPAPSAVKSGLFVAPFMTFTESGVLTAIDFNAIKIGLITFVVSEFIYLL